MLTHSVVAIFRSGCSPTGPSCAQKYVINELELVVHKHENKLPTMAHKVLLGSVKASERASAAICGEHHVARDARVGAFCAFYYGEKK